MGKLITNAPYSEILSSSILLLREVNQVSLDELDAYDVSNSLTGSIVESVEEDSKVTNKYFINKIEGFEDRCDLIIFVKDADKIGYMRLETAVNPNLANKIYLKLVVGLTVNAVELTIDYSVDSNNNLRKDSEVDVYTSSKLKTYSNAYFVTLNPVKVESDYSNEGLCLASGMVYTDSFKFDISSYLKSLMAYGGEIIGIFIKHNAYSIITKSTAGSVNTYRKDGVIIFRETVRSNGVIITYTNNFSVSYLGATLKYTDGEFIYLSDGKTVDLSVRLEYNLNKGYLDYSGGLKCLKGTIDYQDIPTRKLLELYPTFTYYNDEIVGTFFHTFVTFNRVSNEYYLYRRRNRIPTGIIKSGNYIPSFINDDICILNGSKVYSHSLGLLNDTKFLNLHIKKTTKELSTPTFGIAGYIIDKYGNVL